MHTDKIMELRQFASIGYFTQTIRRNIASVPFAGKANITLDVFQFNFPGNRS